jgi:hypothetical protein
MEGDGIRESDIQNAIRLALNPYGTFFRINVGTGWTGESTRMSDGTVIIKNARPFSTGVPPGFSDLFGIATGPVPVFLEVKTETGRVRPEQENFINVMRGLGCRAGIARSPEDAIRIVRGL